MKTVIESCREVRSVAAKIIEAKLASVLHQSEAEVAEGISEALGRVEGVMPFGWYNPPPGGTAILFGQQGDRYERTRFDSLRKELYWPNPQERFGEESVGIVYVSPISSLGAIGDWGATVYWGKDAEIRAHIKRCLATVEQLAEFASVGMSFGDISRHADELLTGQRLTSGRTLLVSRREATGTNCGHTIPWSDAPPSSSELAVLVSNDATRIRQLISDKRVYINANASEIIPNTGAFTVELRLESLDNPSLPNVFFHLITCFEEGEKTIVSNFNPFFKAVGMDYIVSSSW